MTTLGHGTCFGHLKCSVQLSSLPDNRRREEGVYLPRIRSTPMTRHYSCSSAPGEIDSSAADGAHGRIVAILPDATNRETTAFRLVGSAQILPALPASVPVVRTIPFKAKFSRVL